MFSHLLFIVNLPFDAIALDTNMVIKETLDK
jgi:hypothetical protein